MGSAFFFSFPFFEGNIHFKNQVITTKESQVIIFFPDIL